MLSFPPEIVPVGWTLIQERIFFAQPTLTHATRPKLATGNIPHHKMPLFWLHFGFGVAVRVEFGRTKKFLSCINVHPMGTTSEENESILPAQV